MNDTVKETKLTAKELAEQKRIQKAESIATIKRDLTSTLRTLRGKALNGLTYVEDSGMVGLQEKAAEIGKLSDHLNKRITDLVTELGDE